MVSDEIFGHEVQSIDDPTHLSWLDQHRHDLLDFYQPNILLPTGGFAWLDKDGYALPRKGAQLWLGSRMIHVFALAEMLGRQDAGQIVNHGLDFYLDGPGKDKEHGGWFPIVGGDAPSTDKELYGVAHMLLASATSTQAGFPKGPELMHQTLDLIDTHFWDKDVSRGVEKFDQTFSVLDSYRGQNANMHLAEAYIATYEANSDAALLERALTIAKFIAGRALLEDQNNAWRLPEHFDQNWLPLPEHNINDKRHPFRPYGTQVGHWFEWSKLLTQMHGLGATGSWILEAAEILFKKGIKEGWADNGGFFYTLGWDGTPVIADKYFWIPTEALGAASSLWKITGDDFYLDWYRTIWQFANDNFIDHKRGGWYHEIDSNNVPSVKTWEGKPDLYHVFQSTLYPRVPPDKGLAAWAREQQKIKSKEI